MSVTTLQREVEPEEAALILEAAVRVADEGWSLGQVVRDWNDRKIPTVRGAGMWNRTQVRRALLSPRSAGLVAQEGVVQGLGSFQAPLIPELQERVSTALTGRSRGNTVTYSQRRHVLAGFLAQLQASFNAGGIRFADYNTALSALRTQQEATGRALSDLQVSVVVPDDLDVLAVWEEGEVEERRELLATLVDHIKLLPVGKVGPIRMREMTPLTTEVVWI